MARHADEREIDRERGQERHEEESLARYMDM